VEATVLPAHTLSKVIDRTLNTPQFPFA